MNKLYIMLLPILFCCGCSIKKNFTCDENQNFKKVFYKSIEIAEAHTLRQKPDGSFLGALEFISKYVDVSYDKIYNYEVRYPTYESFNLDKEKWIKWYEENKCNNIQFK